MADSMDRCGETADLKPCRRSCSEHTRRSCAEQSQRSVLTGVLGIAVLALVGALARPPCTSDSSALSTNPEYWELPADSNLSLAHDHQASAIFPPDSSQHADHSSPLILVAGLSRTGTSSVQQALSLLNLTVFHTHETMRHHLDFWYYYLDGKISQPDVRALIDPLGVQAISDCWFAYLAPEIIRAYPSAKVILGTRDVLSWLRSYNSYIDSSDLYHWGRQLRRLVLSRTSRLLQLGPTLRSAGLVASEGGLDLEKLPILMHVWRRIDKVCPTRIVTRANFNKPLRIRWCMEPTRQIPCGVAHLNAIMRTFGHWYQATKFWNSTLAQVTAGEKLSTFSGLIQRLQINF